MTARVSTSFDLESPFTVSVLENGKEIAPTELNQRIISGTIKFWLPRMRKAFTTYPTAEYRLLLRGKNHEGKEFEDVVFVGSNWIGDGLGVATLADTTVFKLHMAIRETIANKAVDAMPTNARLFHITEDDFIDPSNGDQLGVGIASL